jgi:hypothetical protein
MDAGPGSRRPVQGRTQVHRCSNGQMSDWSPALAALATGDLIMSFGSSAHAGSGAKVRRTDLPRLVRPRSPICL